MNNLKTIILTLLAAAAVPVTTKAQNPGEEDSIVKVNVAFQQKDASDILGGVSYIDVKSNYEKNFHTYALDDISSFMSGVSGYNGNIHGKQNYGYYEGSNSYTVSGAPIVVVDGVIRDMNNVSVSEIEQITVLKSAEAVILYGSYGCNGAIIVTTKRGRHEGLQITGRVSSGANVAVAYPEYMGAAEYMDTYNQMAKANGSTVQRYSDELIYYTAQGKNPYRYQDLNFYSSDYLKKAYNRTDATLELDGGNEKAHFYSNVSYYRQGDFIKVGEGENDAESRLSIRGNVDVAITKNITAYVNANTTFYDNKSGNANFWGMAATKKPMFLYTAETSGDVLIPVDMIDPSNKEAINMVTTSHSLIDGKYFLAGSSSEATNDIASLYRAGSQKNTVRQFQFDAGVKADLSGILDGLYFKTNYSVDYKGSYKTSFDNTYLTFIPTWATIDGVDVITSLESKNKEKKSGVQNIGSSSNKRVVSGNAMFGYNKSFGDHNVNALLVGNVYQYTTAGEYHRASNLNAGLSVDYNFAHKYYANASFAIPHSTKLPEGNRNGFSKSGTIGWNIANEDFLKDNNIISSLSLNANFASIDEDIMVYRWNLYKGNWENGYGSAFSWGDQDAAIKGTRAVSGENQDLTFIKHKSVTATLKAGFLNDMITVEGSYYTETVDGTLALPSSSYPEFLNSNGSFIAYQNINADKYDGFEFGLNFKKSFGDFNLNAGLFANIMNCKYDKFDQVIDNDYEKKAGTQINAYWGLKTAGIFDSQEEIDNYVNPVTGEKITCSYGDGFKPGDLIYLDQDGDNVITDKDKVFLGRWDSPTVLGFNVTASYKNFTLFLAGNAYVGGYGMKSGSYYWVDAESGKYTAALRDCWTAEKVANGESYLYPALSKSSINYKDSDFWMFKENSFQLSRVQLTYDLPSSLFDNNFIGGVSVFGSMSNVFLISKNKEDLQRTIGSAPQTRSIVFGAKITF